MYSILKINLRLIISVTETEVVFRDKHGGLSVYNVINQNHRTLMTNSTFVSYKIFVVCTYYNS